MNRFLGSGLLARRTPMVRLVRNRIAASLVSIPGAVAILLAIPGVSSADVGMTVSGQVADKNGKPQQGYVVSYACTRSASDETSVGGGLSTVTGADGSFEIQDVPPGECGFSTFHAPGTHMGELVDPCYFDEEPCGGPTQATLTIRPGVDVHGLLLKSPVPLPPEVSVSASVVDASGQVVGGYAVIAQCGSSECHTPGARCFNQRLKEEPDGTFSSWLPTGFCRLRACLLDASDECADDWVGEQQGPCLAGEPCADISVTAPGPVDVTLRRGAAQP